MKNKKQKFKWENIKANKKCDFEMTYNETVRLLAHIQNRLQQLAAAYKNKVDEN
ncbi:MAG: hypothetical protein R3Y43_04665 [Alphaproteobacteria bacterium]